MKIGILKETKTPPDKRVPFTPDQCVSILKDFNNVELFVQSSPNRCFSDLEYAEAGIAVVEDLSHCDVLMGVKEVDIPTLIPGKIYLFFSHTAKEQPYNRELLRAVVSQGITLIDYEYLTRKDHSRVVAFGRWAGIVGAYNGLKAMGGRMNAYDLPPAYALHGLEMLKEKLKVVDLRGKRILVTGGGRVAGGAVEVLTAAGIVEVSPEAFLEETFEEAIFTRLDPWHYTRHREGNEFDFSHFVACPGEYENSILPFVMQTDLFMACHFWDPASPVMIRRKDMLREGFPVQVIADISCDIDGPIASTIRASTIDEPVYGYDPRTGKESENPFGREVVTVMAVDNLPGELPRDASADFGSALIENVLPALLGADKEGVVERGTIVKDGNLTGYFSYLENYLEGN